MALLLHEGQDFLLHKFRVTTGQGIVLQAAFANSLDRFSASDCKAFFRHAQYASI
jgi:hypothetical protein